MNPILSIHNLSISFQNQNKANRVVHNVSFEIMPNQIVGVVGESGSGKSVTSMAIMGLLPKQISKVTGTVLYQKISLLELEANQLRKIVGKEISMIFQEPMTSLNPSLTCGEQVSEVLEIHTQLSTKEIEAEVLQLFEKVKLPRAKKMLNQYPHELSGGQKQRVMIAMAIACKPKLLIADEPTTALDVRVQDEIVLLLKELQQETGMSILFITHDLALIAEIANKVVVMQKGKVVEQGNVEQVFLQPKEIYTKALINAKPKLNVRLKELPSVASYIDHNFKEEVYSTKDRAEFHQQIYSKKPLLEIKNLKTYYTSKNNWFATPNVVKGVDDVSFKVYEGETVGLVGESGSGKSTIGRTILGLEKATAGEIWYKGVNLITLSNSQRKKYRQEIQLIFQDPYSSLNPTLKIGEAILEPMVKHKVLENNTKRKEYIYRLLEKVGLEKEHYSRYPHEFSGGQRQRVGIARALALQPKLIICDESVSALDVSVQAQVLNLLNKLKKEFDFTYLFISHDLSIVKFMSDQLIVLNQGKIEEIGDADIIYNQPQKEYTKALIDAIPKGI
ncbi:peptide/nickel transport system ATP-binding protein [Wenyingzhuangia heitensis]|uniref:Peptide/nickel transport system ATP-binding protein n=1 Tax=Wenyingzhuangia heitensis TaxID=1487859 RepID=A0ABX0U8X4_9FLAO|nr:ABC transporter ATP-binding protein [Wenyingzhuangia heitensis]NIJ44061.1 peptide/nickel transport system ATP-binding protein [Wenyingzhuangia heitensis]